MNGAGLVLVTLGLWLTCQVLLAKPSLVSIVTAYRSP